MDQVDQMEIDIIKNIVITLIIGFMIGLQREMCEHSKEHIRAAGTRTFTLISLLGYLSAWMQTSIPYFLHVSLFLFGSLILATYIYKTVKSDSHGTTTEISAFVTYTLGMMMHHFFQTVCIGKNISEKLCRRYGHCFSDHVYEGTR